MLRGAILQPKALPALMAISTAPRFNAGSAPGSPRQTAHTCVLAAAPNCVEQPQKIFERVRSWAWTSRPITGSKSAIGISAALQHRRQGALGGFRRSGETQERLFLERLANQLQADGELLRIEPAGHRDPGKA